MKAQFDKMSNWQLTILIVELIFMRNNLSSASKLWKQYDDMIKEGKAELERRAEREGLQSKSKEV